MARRYDESAVQLQSTLKMDPNFLLAHLNLGSTYNYQGKYTEAAAHERKGLELVPGSLWARGLLGATYALSGQKDKARNEMAIMQSSPNREEAAYHLAIIATALGERENAFHWLRVARDLRSGSMILLKMVPYFDPLRSDARFVALLHNVGLDPTDNAD